LKAKIYLYINIFLIADLLSEVSLAYWIMDDGSFTGSGLKLHTNAFSLEELNLLIKALDKNFSIKASVNVSNREKSQFSLYISKNQMSLVKDLVIKPWNYVNILT